MTSDEIAAQFDRFGLGVTIFPLQSWNKKERQWHVQLKHEVENDKLEIKREGPTLREAMNAAWEAFNERTRGFPVPEQLQLTASDEIPF